MSGDSQNRCQLRNVCLLTLSALTITLTGCGGGGGDPPGGTCTNAKDGDYPGCGVSKSTYSCNDPVAGWNFMNRYFPVDTPTDECTDNICSCPASGNTEAWQIQQGRVYAKRAGATGTGGHAGNGFGLHLVNVSKHLTTGGESTAFVENVFTQKMAGMKSFDSFMDYNVVFATDGLQAYKDTFGTNNVPHLQGTWNSADGKAYTSVIIQVPNTQMILELVQATSLKLAKDEAKPHVMEQRVPTSALRQHEARKSTLQSVDVTSGNTVGAIITPLVVNRAASATSMAKLEEFYVTGMGTTKTHDSTADGVTKKCFLWTGATVDVCFTQRPDSETKGEWQVLDFENNLKTVHQALLGGHPFCGMDKWVDNHYAIDSRTADTSKMIEYINSKKPLHYCESHGNDVSLHYVFDPTGWGIQVDMQFSSSPADCSSSMVKGNKKSMRSPVGVTGVQTNPACAIDLTKCPSLSGSANHLQDTVI